MGKSTYAKVSADKWESGNSGKLAIRIHLHFSYFIFPIFVIQTILSL